MDYPIDGEYFTQCEVDLFKFAEESLQFVVAYLQLRKDVITPFEEKALKYIHRYAEDWTKIPLSTEYMVYLQFLDIKEEEDD